MDRYPCPACKQNFPNIKQLNAHGNTSHGLPAECKICDRSFQSHHHLLDHMRAAPKQHCLRHTQKCKILGCSPQSCIGIPFKSTGASGASDPVPRTSPNMTSSKAQVQGPAPKKGTGPTLSTKPIPGTSKQCYICNKNVVGEIGLLSHIRNSKSHRERHSRRCSTQNCEPTKCFGQPPVSHLKVAEPGPPDPIPMPSSSNKSTKTSTKSPKKKPREKNVPNRSDPLSSRKPAASAHIFEWSFKKRKAGKRPRPGIPKWPPPLGNHFESKGQQWSLMRFDNGFKGLIKCYYCHAFESPRRQWTHRCAIF